MRKITTKLILGTAVALIAFSTAQAGHFRPFHPAKSVFNANGGAGGNHNTGRNAGRGGNGGTIKNARHAPAGSTVNANGGRGGNNNRGTNAGRGGNGGSISF
jgi:hypothetical protein